MNGTRLTGLKGTNPLGFLAALGVQTLFEHEEESPRLWWTDDIIPHAVVDDRFDMQHIIDCAVNRSFPAWRASPALNPRNRADDDAKFSPDDLRDYLTNNLTDSPGNRLATALVAEGRVLKSGKQKGNTKPSDLYFTGGQQKFLGMAREILQGVTKDDLVVGLTGQWAYESTLPSLMWDVADDRIYAISAVNPAKEKKVTNPGPEALAILGFSRHPVFAGPEATLGCTGGWRKGSYTWPLWDKPATANAVKSLLAQASHSSPAANLADLYRGWGIFKILRSAIRGSDYATFGPSEIVWRHP